ncbi:MAG: hypothetical protein KJ015_03170 [Myxococcales bacterium]|nr:hypothetical protein [Myxococcales bacterium]
MGRSWRLVFGLALLAPACGGDDSSDGSGGAASTGGAAGSGAAAGAAGAAGAGGSSGSGGTPSAAKPSPGCSGGGLAPGDSTLKLTHGGVEREYQLHVPPGYDGKAPLPLVLNFHGYTSNAGQQAAFSAMNAKADSAGFLLVYPQGLQNPGTGLTSWNAGLCCAFGDTARDDVGFVGAVLDDVFAKSCVDERRVYATGMSNGGYLSHRLGCELANRFAAIAPVAGVLGIPAGDCKPSRPMPVVHFHGTADSLVAYDGGSLGSSASVPDTFAGWASRNGCSGSPKESFKNGAAHCETYEGCPAGVEVTLCTIDGMGHCWPGQSICPFGQSSTDVSANDRMWELFQKSSLP